MNRYVCIHGHFYQPPRENPWLEEIELQDEVYPFHDWNERIKAECYSQNAASRVLDEHGKIARIINNYSRMSFNFGPTLLSWLEKRAPDTYSAVAQVYNHMILPLSGERDKETQILWGIRDFEHRFARSPEGMWLPETAVDIQSLEFLVKFGIGFTILSPHQARRVRRIGSRSWKDVSGSGIDTSMAYTCRLPSGKSIALFFYNSSIAEAVAFKDILRSGADFANRLLSAFTDEHNQPQLSHIATDGESYGHHHRFGDMALAFALSHIEDNRLARITNYSEFLELHPPTQEVEILENSSWSCSHGLDRWRMNCGCNSGKYPEWNQKWRAPLRASFDWLRNEIDPIYENRGCELFEDPWQARNEYINVILDRSRDNVEEFLGKHSKGDRSSNNDILRLKLLEMQRNAMLMYTSCGWFFDELSEIQTVQVIRYAGRTVQLAQEVFGTNYERRFLRRLEKSLSNRAEYGNGRVIYEKYVKPAMLDLKHVGAHYAVSSLFEDYPTDTSIYCYKVKREAQNTLRSGRTKLSVGRAVISSDISWESSDISYASLHLGDHNVVGGVRVFEGPEAYEKMEQEITHAYLHGSITEVIRMLDKRFRDRTFSLHSLFRDEQRKFLNEILKETLEDAESAYRNVYERNAPVIRFLTDLNMPVPDALRMAAERALNHDLQMAFSAEIFDEDHIERLIEEAGDFDVTLDNTTLGFTLQDALERMVQDFVEDNLDINKLQNLTAAVGLVQDLDFDVSLWKVQNGYYRLQKTLLPMMRRRAMEYEDFALKWIESFLDLGSKLGMVVD